MRQSNRKVSECLDHEDLLELVAFDLRDPKKRAMRNEFKSEHSLKKDF